MRASQPTEHEVFVEELEHRLDISLIGDELVIRQ
jgi:hypothetical protein